jgi:hypothetical protein
LGKLRHAGNLDAAILRGLAARPPIRPISGGTHRFKLRRIVGDRIHNIITASCLDIPLAHR